jgi:hypothetical protein
MRLLATDFLGFDLELRQPGIAVNIVQDRQHLVGYGGIVGLVDRIDLPIIRRTSRIGKAGSVQSGHPIRGEDAGERRPAVGGLGLAIDRRGRGLRRALNVADLRVERDEHMAVEIDPQALDFTGCPRAIEVDQLRRRARGEARPVIRLGAGRRRHAPPSPPSRVHC